MQAYIVCSGPYVRVMPRSNLAKTITLRVSLVPRLQVYHKEEIKKDPRATNEDFGGFLNDKLEQLLDKEEYAKSNFPNCSVLSISDNVIYIKDTVLKGVVEVYYLFLNNLMTSRLVKIVSIYYREQTWG